MVVVVVYLSICLSIYLPTYRFRTWDQLGRQDLAGRLASHVPQFKKKAPYAELWSWPSVVTTAASSEGGGKLAGTRSTKVSASLADPMSFQRFAQHQLEWDLKERRLGYLLFNKNEEWKARRLSATVLPQGFWTFRCGFARDCAPCQK